MKTTALNGVVIGAHVNAEPTCTRRRFRMQDDSLASHVGNLQRSVCQTLS